MASEIEKLSKRTRSALLSVEVHQYVLSKSYTCEEAIEQWTRNGVWGTCCDCPALKIAGRVVTLPEQCKNFGRYDHQLSVSATFKWYRSAVELLLQQAQEALSAQDEKSSQVKCAERDIRFSQIESWKEKYGLSYQEVQKVIESLELVNALN